MNQPTIEDIIESDNRNTPFVIALLQNCYYAALNAEVYSKEKFMSGKRKNALRLIINRLNCALNEVKAFVPAHQHERLLSTICDEETVLQINGIQHMLMSLPKGMRDQAEKHIEGLYNVYSLNNNQK